MNLSLVLAFLFFVGSVFGWFLELFFRRFFSSANPERKWINPGFCVGPYLPLYGSGLCILFLIARLEVYTEDLSPTMRKIVLFVMMAVMMTAVEYIAGIISLKIMHVRLWDYRNEWGNIQGLICPKFSLIWALLGAVYYFLIDPYIIDALIWLSQNLAFSFFIGLFFGVFIIDLCYSSQIIIRIKRFADENNVVVRYENLKAHIRSVHDKNAQKVRFFLPFSSKTPIGEHLKDILGTLERRDKPHYLKGR